MCDRTKPKRVRRKIAKIAFFEMFQVPKKSAKIAPFCLKKSVFAFFFFFSVRRKSIFFGIANAEKKVLK